MAMNSLLVGFPFCVGDSIAEIFLEGLKIAPVPCYLDGMADGPLHPAGRGAESFGHLGVEDLGHRVDDVHILHRDDDGLPQILVALDMGRDADLVDDGGHHALQSALPAGALLPVHVPGGHLAHPLHHRVHPAGLHETVICSRRRSQLRHIAAGKAGEHQDPGMDLQLPQFPQDGQPVLVPEHQVHHHRLGSKLPHQTKDLLSVARLPRHFQIGLPCHCITEQLAELIACVRDQNASLVLHVVSFFQQYPCFPSAWPGHLTGCLTIYHNQTANASRFYQFMVYFFSTISDPKTDFPIFSRK